MIFEEEDMQEQWCEYVGELFDDQRGNIPEFDQLEDLEILLKEVDVAIKSIKNGEAPGDDGVTSKMLQALDQLGNTLVTELCNKVYNTGHFPRHVTYFVQGCFTQSHPTNLFLQSLQLSSKKEKMNYLFINFLTIHVKYLKKKSIKVIVLLK